MLLCIGKGMSVQSVHVCACVSMGVCGCVSVHMYMIVCVSVCVQWCMFDRRCDVPNST